VLGDFISVNANGSWTVQISGATISIPSPAPITLNRYNLCTISVDFDALVYSVCLNGVYASGIIPANVPVGGVVSCLGVTTSGSVDTIVQRGFSYLGIWGGYNEGKVLSISSTTLLSDYLVPIVLGPMGGAADMYRQIRPLNPDPTNNQRRLAPTPEAMQFPYIRGMQKYRRESYAGSVETVSLRGVTKVEGELVSRQVVVFKMNFFEPVAKTVSGHLSICERFQDPT
jgi:hypothetical protein